MLIDQRRAVISADLKSDVYCPFTRRHMVGPFIFFDHIGPGNFYAWHPADRRCAAASAHRARHRHLPVRGRDHASRQRRRAAGDPNPDEVNWMIAGRGITHSGAFREGARARADRCMASGLGGAAHGTRGDATLRSHHYGADASAACTKTAAYALRLLAGAGFRSARRREDSLAACFYAHWELDRGARRALPARISRSARCTLPAGEVERARAALRRRQDAGVRARRRTRTITGLTQPSIADRARRRAVDGRCRLIEWNFVSFHRKSASVRRRPDFGARRHAKLPDFDGQEFIHAHASTRFLPALRAGAALASACAVQYARAHPGTRALRQVPYTPMSTALLAIRCGKLIDGVSDQPVRDTRRSVWIGGRTARSLRRRAGSPAWSVTPSRNDLAAMLERAVNRSWNARTTLPRGDRQATPPTVAPRQARRHRPHRDLLRRGHHQ
mgnify:CR=1 FL=1